VLIERSTSDETRNMLGVAFTAPVTATELIAAFGEPDTSENVLVRDRTEQFREWRLAITGEDDIRHPFIIAGNATDPDKPTRFVIRATSPAVFYLVDTALVMLRATRC